MSLIAFLLIGLLAGWIAGEITKGEGFGFVGNILIGAAGAVIGGFTFDLLGVSAYGFTGSLIMSVLGALLVLFLVGLFRPAGNLGSGPQNQSHRGAS